MLKVTVADCENNFVGIFNTKDEKAAITNLKNEHNWTAELEFHECPGPAWASNQSASGFLARPNDFKEDPECIRDHEGTAWVYVEPVIYGTMAEV